MENKWKSASHNKYLLQYHLIYVCKYRKKLLVSPYIADDVKRLSAEICNKHRVNIKYMETDKDHIHYMIETRPNINISDFIRTMKGYISYHIWDKYSDYLLKQFWKESTFWTDGYFICSVGNVSEKTLKEYIEHQGQEVWSCIKQSNIGYILQNYNQSNLQRHLVVVVRYGILCSMIR